MAEHKDNNVFKDLAVLAAPDLEPKAAAATSKELCQVQSWQQTRLSACCALLILSCCSPHHTC